MILRRHPTLTCWSCFVFLLVALGPSPTLGRQNQEIPEDSFWFSRSNGSNLVVQDAITEFIVKMLIKISFQHEKSERNLRSLNGLKLKLLNYSQHFEEGEKFRSAQGMLGILPGGAVYWGGPQKITDFCRKSLKMKRNFSCHTRIWKGPSDLKPEKPCFCVFGVLESWPGLSF